MIQSDKFDSLNYYEYKKLFIKNTGFFDKKAY